MRISKRRQLLVLFFAFAIFFVGCDVKIITPILTTEKKLDLGVTSNYEVEFNVDYDFDRLAKDGFRRVNLYYQWREFEADGIDGLVTSWKDQIDPIIKKLKSLGIMGGRSFVVTETGYPTEKPSGTIETQTKYAKDLITYLKTSGVKAEFVSWWPIADSPTHPDEFFHSMGLTTFDGVKRPAYDIWAKASKGE